MKNGNLSGIKKSGFWLLILLAISTATFFSSCEDDPIVEPKDGAQIGGSYGGRLSLPDSNPQNNNTVQLPANQQNPELF